MNRKVKRWKKQRTLEQQQKLLTVGKQDYMDLLSYDGLEEQASFVVVDDTYLRTVFISGYPYHAMTGWLSNLIAFNRVFPDACIAGHRLEGDERGN